MTSVPAVALATFPASSVAVTLIWYRAMGSRFPAWSRPSQTSGVCAPSGRDEPCASTRTTVPAVFLITTSTVAGSASENPIEVIPAAAGSNENGEAASPVGEGAVESVATPPAGDVVAFPA